MDGRGLGRLGPRSLRVQGDAVEPTTVTVLPGRDGRRVVRCTGAFDFNTMAPLQAACDTALAEAGVERLVLDVRGVTFGDSTFLNLLLTLCGQCDLRLWGPLPRQLARLLAVTGTNQVLTIEHATAGKAAE
ncbi:STAS domain-containing protein [Streptomyces sp. NPDC051704]|uniref:STAS domain-containing protein n=1 Tax=Streptomyces sp. NPDC051704 TaxID=3365671 RepID=UPI00378A6BC1